MKRFLSAIARAFRVYPRGAAPAIAFDESNVPKTNGPVSVVTYPCSTVWVNDCPRDEKPKRAPRKKASTKKKSSAKKSPARKKARRAS